MEILGVGAQAVRRDDHKTAADPLTEDTPSDLDIAQKQQLLDDMFNEMVRGIADGRSKAPKTVRDWIDGGPHTAEEALALGMVDGLLYADELPQQLSTLYQRRMRVTALHKLPQPTSAWDAPRQVAVVYIDHTIAQGDSTDGGILTPATTGSRTVVRQLNRARRDSAVRAVVLRIDTPGGSAFASEEIWRAVSRLSSSKKPVVVSMGESATSGGYYVASAADAIVTTPMTVTGSIGAVAYKINVQGLIGRLGIESVGITRGAHADMWATTRPWDDPDQARAQALLDATYHRFRLRVAQGRSLSDDAVDDLAGGRLWSGQRAVDLGLADQTGGIIEAVEKARELAGIPDGVEVVTVTYREPRPLMAAFATDIVLGPLMPLATTLSRELSPPPPAVNPLFPRFGPLWTVASHPQELIWVLDPWTATTAGPR